MIAFQCDYCAGYFQGHPVHSISLNATVRWVDFDSTKCMAMWIVGRMDGTDLLDIRILAMGKPDDDEHQEASRDGE